ncbi:MAG: hypothetical protein LBK71_06865, partial [Verrucomicrobiales bacterium]|nr:hypothetical protein [Verrucomicrobiales bacterium]
ANKFSLNRSADGESALGGSGIYIAADGDVLLTGEIATLEDNFHLQTNGRVELDEVSISAADSARIERLDAEADVPTVTADDFTVSAENHVEIFAGAVDLTHGAIATVSGHITLGNRDEAATGNFHFVGTAPGDGLRAGGGLGLYAQGQDVCLAQLDLRAADGVEIVAKEFTLARGADAESSLSADVFYLQATGDVRLTGDLTTATGDVLVVANQAVLLDGARIQAGHHLRIEQLDANLPAPTVTGRAGGGRGFLLGADGEVAILSGAVDLRHGQIITQNGAVILGRQDEDAAGDFRFAGADADDGIYSAAGLGIYARGKDVVLEKLHLEAAGLAEMVADNFTVADRDSSVSVGGFDLAATGAVGLTGDLRAADGDWRMATNGAARLADVRLVTVGNILLEKLDPAGAVPTLTLGDFELLAAGNIELLSGANELRRGTLTTQAGSVVIGSADATGDFRFVGEDAGDGIYAAGGVGLYAPGRSMQLENLQIQAAGMAEVLSNDFTLGNSTVSAGGFALAAAGKARLTNDELTATKGDWRMAANDEVRADGVRLTAAGGILLEKLNSAGAAPVLTLSDFALSAAGNIELLSGANELRHGTLRTRAGSVLIGSADATGDFRFIGVDADDGIYSANGIGLYAPGQNVILEKLQIIAAGHTAAASQDFTSRDTTVSVGSFDLAASGDIWLNRELTTTAGDWRMAANGEVHLDGARLSAAGSILLEKLNAAGAAPLLTLTDFTLSAVGNIELQSGANELRHGTLTTRAGSVVIGSADATGDFRFIGLGADDGIYAGHSVGLYAPGQSMWLEKIQITANSAAELTAGTLTVTGRLEDGVWLPSSIQADRQHILVSGQVTISAAALLAQQDFILDSGALRVAAVHDGQAWQAANISAHEGELLVSARAGDVVNEGSRLQGRRVTLRADGDVYNHTLDENTPGIIFASGADDGDLTINSGGDVTNLTGRLIGNGAVSISAAGKVYHGTAHTDEPGSGEKIYYTRKSGWFFWRQKTSGWYLKLSDLTVSGQLAYILAGKGLAIAADELENDGAEIIANGGDLRIDVSRLVNRAIASGEANFERRAYYLWRRDRGASTMQVHGGHISAAGALTVNAAESVTDRGGQMLAMSDLTISAPRINARAIELFSYYQRQDGMREIWLGEHVRLRSSQSGAEFISWGGAVNLFSPEPAHIYGGGVQAAGAVNAPGGLDLTVPEVEREPYGFLHFMF